MIPPLSTTPSAPTMTRSTFSKTYLQQMRVDGQVLLLSSCCDFYRRRRRRIHSAHPTAASRTTVTGTFSFFRASAICRLEKQKRNKMKGSHRQRSQKTYKNLYLFLRVTTKPQLSYTKNYVRICRPHVATSGTAAQRLEINTCKKILTPSYSQCR